MNDRNNYFLNKISNEAMSSLDDLRLAHELIERNPKMIVDYPSLESLLIKLKWIIDEREEDLKKKNYE